MTMIKLKAVFQITGPHMSNILSNALREQYREHVKKQQNNNMLIYYGQNK